MHSAAARIALALVGVVLLVSSFVGWAIENEYGSGTNFAIEGQGQGNVIVFDIDEQAGTRARVFEGSTEEAQAYIEQRQAEGKSFLFPGSLLALGGVLLLVAVLYPRKRKVRNAVSEARRPLQMLGTLNPDLATT